MVPFAIVALVFATSSVALSASGSVPEHEHAVSPNLNQRQEAQVGSTEDPAEIKQKYIRVVREAVTLIDEMLGQMEHGTTKEPAAKE